MNMNLVNSDAEKVDIGTHYQEHRHEECEDKMNVAVDPTEVSETIDRFIIEKSVHQ